jgi:hypothetical protein
MVSRAGVYPGDDVATAGESVADSEGTLAAPAVTDLPGLNVGPPRMGEAGIGP